jgi:hypothetical protein
MVRLYLLNFLICIAVFICIGGTVQGQVIFQDNFENVTGLPSPSTDPNVRVIPVASVGSWTAQSDPNNAATVLSGNNPGAYNGKNYYYMNRFGPGGSTSFGTTGAVAHFSQVSSAKTYISFALYVASGGYTELWVYDANDSTTAHNVLILRFSKSGSVLNNDFADWVDTGLVASQGVWHDVRIEIDFSSSTYDLFIDARKAGGLDFANFASQAGSMEFYLDPVESLPVTAYIDNLKVESGSAACSEQLAGDLNGDCKVNFIDFARFAQNWLACTLTPSSTCN